MTRLQKIAVAVVGPFILAKIWAATVSLHLICKGETPCIAVDALGVLGVGLIVGFWWALSGSAWKPRPPSDDKPSVGSDFPPT